mmetsp:Transcript_5266/g.33091  ORF Transcript_5266/g.33091 Transcript_5266/m.33091 type:complete len:109 (-) Transcript_5266:2626-2952(-)
MAHHLTLRRSLLGNRSSSHPKLLFSRHFFGVQIGDACLLAPVCSIFGMPDGLGGWVVHRSMGKRRLCTVLTGLMVTRVRDRSTLDLPSMNGVFVYGNRSLVYIDPSRR